MGAISRRHQGVEASVRRRALQALARAYGDDALVWSQTGAIGAIGRPDVVACIRGRFVAIEFKAPGKRPRPDQLAQLERVERAGGVAIIYDGAGDIVEIIEAALC
jgi:hypothetical protein